MSGDYRPTAGWTALRRRAELLRQLRSFFDERGFVEVETPILSADTVVDRHLDPVLAPLADGRRRWLQTSPEFGMKRLLASPRDDPSLAGIYQITRAFRAGERGARHNPEFTILEWYELDVDYQRGRNTLAELARRALGVAEVEHVSYAASFQEAVGFDPHTASCEQLRLSAQALLGSAAPTLPADDRDSWLDLFVIELVEPTWNRAHPVIVYDYPASQSALAQVQRQGNADVARRFELYFRGLELANGYLELLDPEVLLHRNRTNNEHRLRDGKAPLPEDSRLLQAMRAGLPCCCGVALGVDRLLMAILAVQHIDEVIAFPSERA